MNIFLPLFQLWQDFQARKKKSSIREQIVWGFGCFTSLLHLTCIWFLAAFCDLQWISWMFSIQSSKQTETYKPEHWKLWTAQKEKLLASALPLFSCVDENIEGNCLNQLSFTAKETKEKNPQNCQHSEISTKRTDHSYSSSRQSQIYCWPYFNTFLNVLKINFIWKQSYGLVVVHLESGD